MSKSSYAPPNSTESAPTMPVVEAPDDVTTRDEQGQGKKGKGKKGKGKKGKGKKGKDKKGKDKKGKDKDGKDKDGKDKDGKDKNGKDKKGKGKKGTKGKKGKKGNEKSQVEVALRGLTKKQRPKAKCCVSRPRCRRCPLAMLRDGTLPPGLTVKRRRLVPADPD